MSAPALAAHPRTALPPVARLGFDAGWLLLTPTFLNLQRPVLLVDQIHIGPTTGLGLEPFGSRDPRSPLGACGIEVVVAGSGVSLWSAPVEPRGLLATHWFDTCNYGDACWGSSEVVLLVGDTYAVDTSWSALWSCLIGKAGIERSSSRSSCTPADGGSTESACSTGKPGHAAPNTHRWQP